MPNTCLPVAAVFFMVLGAAPAAAATLLSVELSMDGSADPPGDVLTCVVAFAPTEEQMQLELRALRVTPAAEIEPVASEDRDFRDGDGHFRQRVGVIRLPGKTIAKKRIVVPYRCLSLPIGTHRIGYEVRGVVQGKEIFRSATRLTELEVTKQRRQKIERKISVDETIRERRPTTAYVLSDGKLEPREVELDFPQVVTRERTAVAPADIPGAYHRREIDEVRRGEQDAARPAAMLDEFVPATNREILFATNRTLVLPNEPTLHRFGDELGAETSYGVCRVNIPVAHHVRGALELPPRHWWRRKADHYFLVESVATLSEQQLLQRTSEADVLLFVHGYSTSMPMAVLRTAQVQHDIEFPGRAMTFAWPSHGRIDRYRQDEKLAEASAEALADVLEAVIQQQFRAKSGKLHLVAHSLGNRLLLRAVHRLHLDNRLNSKRAPFGNVVLAAADVSPATFQRCLPPLLKSAGVVTYYYSLEDVALETSAMLHGTARVGLHPVMVAGVDTINADNANSRFYFSLGHTYYASSDPVLTDLRLFLCYQLKPPQRRPPLGRRSLVQGLPHWEFTPVSAWGDQSSEED